MSGVTCLSMSTRAYDVTHLCFSTSGVIQQITKQLGDTIGGYDITSFYGQLAAVPTNASDPSLLSWDVPSIDTVMNSTSLASLRAAPQRAVLVKALNARQNAYFAKYGNAQAIINEMTQFYSLSSDGSKPNLLQELSSLAQSQADQLTAAYVADGREGVIKSTVSALTSTTTSKGLTTETGQTNSASEEQLNIPATGLPGLSPGGKEPPVWTFGQGAVDEQIAVGTSGETANSTGSATENQYISNTDYGYRYPSIETDAQNARAQISLMDEQFTQFMSTLNLPNLAQVFQNELNSIDNDVYRLQIAYVETYLLPPIDGYVTGLYKQPGEWVNAGEPVMRVEGIQRILLVASIKCSGSIVLGQAASIATPIFNPTGTSTTITGTVVSVRGGSEDDQWDVIIKCNNLASNGHHIFPLGYKFAPDLTTITLS